MSTIKFHTYIREGSIPLVKYCNWQGEYSCGSCFVRGTRVAPTKNAGAILTKEHPNDEVPMENIPLYWYDGDELPGKSPQEVIDTLRDNCHSLGMSKVPTVLAKEILRYQKEDLCDEPNYELLCNVDDNAMFFMEQGIEDTMYITRRDNVIVFWNIDNFYKELEEVQKLCVEHNIKLHYV